MTTLSDIVSADGQVILTLSWNGLQIPDRSSTMQFARQLQPTVYQCGLWCRLLRSYLGPGSKASALQLQQPLGVWITEPNMKWGAMTWEETLYRRDPYTDSGERSVALHYPRNLVHSDGISQATLVYLLLTAFVSLRASVVAGSCLYGLQPIILRPPVSLNNSFRFTSLMWNLWLLRQPSTMIC